MDIFPLFGFVEAKNILIIIHLLGVALGLGGAVLADLMFVKTMKDGTINKDEFSFLSMGGTVVWVGLSLLVISGAGMFFLNPAQYAESSKFLTKITVIGVLVVNAVIFHAVHIPKMKAQVGKRFAESRTFMKNSNLLLVSGVVSIVSWLSALVLATFSSIPISYGILVLLYLGALLLGLCIGFLAKNHFIPKK